MGWGVRGRKNRSRVTVTPWAHTHHLILLSVPFDIKVWLWVP